MVSLELLKLDTNDGNVKIKGKTYPIVAICMDYISVIVDDTININDEVTIIGDDITLSQVARNSGDNVHHLLVSITNRLPRIYVEKGEK